MMTSRALAVTKKKCFDDDFSLLNSTLGVGIIIVCTSRGPLSKSSSRRKTKAKAKGSEEDLFIFTSHQDAND